MGPSYFPNFLFTPESVIVPYSEGSDSNLICPSAEHESTIFQREDNKKQSTWGMILLKVS